MSENQSIDIGTLIARDPQFRDGRPYLRGTGVTVHRIAGWFKLGYDAEGIAWQLPHLSREQVYAALAYYHANKAEIEGILAEESADYERLSREFSKVSVD